MKLAVAVLLASVCAASAALKMIDISPPNGQIAAGSAMGMKLLSKARRLEEEADDEDEEADQDAEEEIEENSWIAGYSLKFQGCHHIRQWNDNADDDNDVRIETKRLVRFRMCPTDYCADDKTAGCSSSYGDYVIDMNTYVAAYYEAKQNAFQYQCEVILANCDCDEDGNDDGDDEIDEEKCEYDCYAAAGMEACADNNPYDDDEAEDAFELEVENYLACAQVDFPEAQEEEEAEEGDDAAEEEGDDAAEEGDDAGRRLEDGNADDEANDDEEAYYVGPYCAEQGGSIYLGVFTDDSCSTFADDTAGKEIYMYRTGESLPYSSESIVSLDCYTCLEPQNADEQNEDDAADEDQIAEVCENVYVGSGKCEENLPDATYPNSNACNYIEGIKVVRNDGIITTSEAVKNNKIIVAIVFFALTFFGMAFYVFFLRRKLSRVLKLSDS